MKVIKFGSQSGESLPYHEVIKEYKDSALHNIDEREIPPNMKEIVREYFMKLDGSD